jgi:hypothetical protein
VSYEPVVAEAARAAARQLAARYGPRVEAEVEATLYAEEEGPPPQFVDPVAVGGLIVAIATLAYQIYSDHKKQGEKPTRDAIERRVRVERRREVDLTAAEEKIIEIVSAEIVQRGDERGAQ